MNHYLKQYVDSLSLVFKQPNGQVHTETRVGMYTNYIMQGSDNQAIVGIDSNTLNIILISAQFVFVLEVSSNGIPQGSFGNAGFKHTIQRFLDYHLMMNKIMVFYITALALIVRITNGLCYVFSVIYIYKTTFELIRIFCSLIDPVNAVKQTMSKTSLEINPISELIILKYVYQELLVCLKPKTPIFFI